MIECWSKQIFEVRRVLGYLLLILLLGDEINSPTLVQLGNQMNTLRVVDSVLLPALSELTLQLLGLFRENVSSFLEIATD